MGIRKRFLSVFFATSMTFFLPGCLGSRDINDLAIVMAVGVDQGDTPNRVRVTVQVANPANAVGQAGSTSGSSGMPTWTATAEGASIFEAIRNLGAFSSKRIYWGHNNLVVFGQDYAKRGITDAIDFFTRNHELRMRTWVALADGNAQRFLATPTGLHSISAESIDRVFRDSRAVSGAPQIDMRLLQAAYLRQPSSALMPVLKLNEADPVADEKGEFSKPQIELNGTGYFRGDKLVGILTPQETHGLTWFVRQAQGDRILAVPCPDHPDQTVSVEMKSSKFHTTPLIVKGKPAFYITLTTNLDLVEIGCKGQKSTLKLLPGIEKETSALFRQEVLSAVRAAQGQGTDFLMLSQVFRRKYPYEWEQLQKRWAAVFATAPVNIQVTSHIYNSGLLQVPTLSDESGQKSKEDPVL